MTLHNPPSWLQNGSHPAENDRNTITAVAWYREGVLNTNDLVVTQAGTPSMTVSVAAGRAIIKGTETATQGNYIVWNDGSINVSIATASPTLPRIDLIVLTVQDSYYSGSNNQVIAQAITGTPNASPVAPSAPNNSIVLAQVAVAANTTAIVNGNITDKRTNAALSDLHAVATTATADTIVAETIAGQTGKALKVTDSTGTQTFAIAPNGTLTFPDGTTQNTAAFYNPNITVNAQTGTTYTPVVSDAQKLITLSNSSAITLTIASNATQALPVGTQITISQYGAGQVTVVGASSPNPVTIVSTGLTANSPKLRAQYSTATLIQTSTDNWLVVGDIA